MKGTKKCPYYIDVPFTDKRCVEKIMFICSMCDGKGNAEYTHEEIKKEITKIMKGRKNTPKETKG